MTRKTWPRLPSARFESWRQQFEEHRLRHAPTGRHFRATAGYKEQLYYAQGGLEEVTTVGDLGWLAAVDGRLRISQQIVWDAHAAEVLLAAAEGGLEATAEALRNEEHWVIRLERDGKAVDERSDAARWISGVLGTCPENPLIRAEEVWGLWESVVGARRIGDRIRDGLLLELEDSGTARTRMAQALGWSYERFLRHLTGLLDDREDLRRRASAGKVPGVLALDVHRSARQRRG